MDSITVGRPIKNRLGAHACHSFLSVPASQTVVSLCTIFLPSLHLYSLFYRLPVDKPANRLAEHCLYVCTYFSFFFSPLWTWSTNVVLDFISPQFVFFFVCFRAPLPPYVLSLPPLPCVLIWKCFGLQRMVMHMTPTVRLTTATIHTNIRTSK